MGDVDQTFVIKYKYDKMLTDLLHLQYVRRDKKIELGGIMTKYIRILILLVVFMLLSSFSFAVTKDDVTSANDKINAEMEQDKLVIDFLRDESCNDFRITFDYGGVNELYGINFIEYINIGGSCLEEESLKSFAETDWVGPYMVREENDSIQNKYFTGGWHSNPKDKSKTAKTESVRFIIDEKEVSKGKYIVTDHVEIYVTNLVEGYNSSGFILKEHIRYKITNDEINVSVSIEALSDISIQKYYGLQSYNKLWQGEVDYIKLNDHIRTIHLESKDGTRTLDIIMMGSNLGTFEYKDIELDSAFTEVYGKSYFNLVNGKELHIEKGEHVFWNGLYRIN